MVPTSRALADTLSRAANYARQQGHRLVGLEHVLLALTEDEDAVAVLSSSSIELARLRNDVAAHIGRIEDRAHPQDPSGPGVHPDVKRILEYAAAAAQQSRRPSINGAIVLAAIVGEGHSTAAGLLRGQGLTFEAAIHALQRAFAASSAPARQAPDGEVASAATLEPPMPDAAPAPPMPSSRVTDAILAGARERVRASRIAAVDGALPHAGPIPGPDASPGLREPPSAAPQELALPTAEALPTHVVPQMEPVASMPGEPSAPPELSLPPNPSAGNEAPLRPPMTNGSMPHGAPAGTLQMPQADRWGGPAAPAFPQGRQPPLPHPTAPPSRDVDPGLPGGPPQMRPPPERLPASPRMGDPYAGPAGHSLQLQTTTPPVPHLPPMHRPPIARAPMRLDAAGYPMAGSAPERGLPVSAPWPEAAMPPHATAEPPALPIDGNFAGAPYPAAEDVSPRHVSTTPARGTAIAGLQPGQMVDTIPRSMQVGRPETVEIRIARSSFEALAQGMPGRAHTFRHDIAVMRAMSVRLKSVDGTFWIETMSPETQWVENRPGLTYDDFATWRWSVTPRRRGRGELQLVVTCRTVGDDGLAADTALPEHSFAIKMRRDYIGLIRRWIGRLVAMAVGAAIAKLSDGTLVTGIKALRALTGI